MFRDVERRQHVQALIDHPLYLDRCQVDTPTNLVAQAWALVGERRSAVGSVVDFGAGDFRFAALGGYTSYIGYEIDPERCAAAQVDTRVTVVADCAFGFAGPAADLCIGNPPYVRNQDLPIGWRVMAAAEIQRRTDVAISGLANAWQYFMLLGLASTKPDGLLVQVLPFEWVSRPAARALRNYIQENKWDVDVYRVGDGVFDGVLTAASLSVVDKLGKRGGLWRFFELDANGRSRQLSSMTGDPQGSLAYSRRRYDLPHAKRGLSPGTQAALVFTEGERLHAGLHITRDVVRCVTSLRAVPPESVDLTEEQFNRSYRDAGEKCWLLRTDREPSDRVQRYLASVHPSRYQTATCLGREVWWRFAMPSVPQLLVAQTFKGERPKSVLNSAQARCVGAVAGVYGCNPDDLARVLAQMHAMDFSARLVPYAKSLYKLEIGQLNGLIIEWTSNG